MSNALRLPPLHLLACPRCGADINSGLAPSEQSCHHCEQTFFDLDGMPCWFQVGEGQRQLWQSLYGLALQQSKHNFRLTEQQSPNDLLPSSQQRIQTIQKANRQIIEDVKELLDGVGLTPEIAPEFANYDASRMLQYFELLLRDWAWDDAVTPGENENITELKRVRTALASSNHILGDTLVMGAGAGRLSWDIQCQLHPTSTIALDTNPVLISAAHRLVAQQKPWHLTELQPNPQAGREPKHRWQLRADPGDEQSHNRWFAMAANAWSPPLKAGAFDTIVTPWFIDVNGKEVRTLIAQVQRLLKPGGLWLNTGPLLYGTDIPYYRRYSTTEIIELVTLAGFKPLYENVETTPYLKTPLSAQLRTEQVWTFTAQAPLADSALPVSTPPAWILLPHLPIPALQIARPSDPALQHLLNLIDGKRSVNDIAAQLAPNLEKGKDPVALVQTIFMEYFLN